MSQAGRTFLLSTYYIQGFMLAARRNRETTKDRDSLCPFWAFILVGRTIYAMICLVSVEKGQMHETEELRWLFFMGG